MKVRVKGMVARRHRGQRGGIGQVPSQRLRIVREGKGGDERARMKGDVQEIEISLQS